jgi:hypothetical protein
MHPPAFLPAAPTRVGRRGGWRKQEGGAAVCDLNGKT